MRKILLCGFILFGFFWGAGCQKDPPKTACPKCAANEICDVDKGACIPRPNTCGVSCGKNADCANNEFCDTDNCCRPCLQGGLCGREPSSADGGTEVTPEQTTNTEQNPDGADTGENCTVREDCKPGLICDASRNICVCLRDSSCPKEAPRCGATGFCIQCLSDAECPITGQKCDPQTFRCKGGTTPCKCPTGQKCNDKDQCIPVCDGVTCPADQRCDPNDGKCKTPGCLPIKGCPKSGDCCNEDGSCTPCGSSKICDPCQKAADCGDGNACNDLGGGSKFCTRECTVNSCPSGFTCKALGDYGRQCVPTSGSCSLDKCAGRQCPSGLYCCPKDGQCHDCCQDSHCPLSTCDLQSFTCKTSGGGCNPPCSGGTKCCVNLSACRACCSDADCGGSGLVCNNGTCGPPVRNCKLSDPLGSCSSDSECCAGQTCVAAGLGRNCEPCASDSDCPKIGGFVPTSCCTKTLSGQMRRYCATTCP